MKQERELDLSHKIICQLRRAGQFTHYRMGGRVGRRRVLIELSARPGLLQRELQQRLNIQAGSLSELIAKMEADGVLTRNKSPDDGRNFVLSLTAVGWEQSRRVRDEYDRRVSEMMSCLSKSEQEQLHALLGTMLAHWDSLDAELDDMQHSEDNEGV